MDSSTLKTLQAALKSAGARTYFENSRAEWAAAAKAILAICEFAESPPSRVLSATELLATSYERKLAAKDREIAALKAKAEPSLTSQVRKLRADAAEASIKLTARERKLAAAAVRPLSDVQRAQCKAWGLSEDKFRAQLDRDEAVAREREKRRGR